MRKQKVHNALRKRVRVSKGGKILRGAAGKSHLMSGKSGKTRRRLKRPRKVQAVDAKRVKRLLGMR